MKQNMDLPSCKWNLLKVFILICTTLASTLSFGQVAPMNPPTGGMNIDGYLQRQGAAGDWLAGPGGNAAGSFIFPSTPIPPGTMGVFPGLVPRSWHAVDLWNDQDNDDIFDGGNKLNQNPNNWGWRSQKPPAKDDINHAQLLFSQNPQNGDIWIAMSGDRFSNNGTSYIDFEFFQKSIAKVSDDGTAPVLGSTGKFISAGTEGGRTVGDLDITLEFTNGGAVATVGVYQWQALSEAGQYGYVAVSNQNLVSFAVSNTSSQTVNVPYGAFGATTYGDFNFVEGVLNLSALLNIIVNGQCSSLPYNYAFVKTKSSAEVTADLKDFIAPFALNICFDDTPPVITGPSDKTLPGCNPDAENLPWDSPTGSDNCGFFTVVPTDGPIQSTGCNRSRTRTFTATDGCGNTATADQVISWKEDNTAPSLSAGGTTTTLGCNPSAGDINNALGTASATDACGAPTINMSDGDVTSTGCGRSQTRSWTARDACNNTATISRTVTWTADVTPPVITTGGTTTTLGCNPSAGDINNALGTATATDACGTPTVSAPSDGTVGSNGCSRSQTRTWTARDFCGNTSTASRTVTWIVDVTPPVITTGGTGTSLGCNPSAGDINNALGTATATDACGVPSLVSSSDGTVGSDGCTRTQTRRWTFIDFCGNTSTASRSISWTADVTPPVITTGGTTTTLGCNPSAGDINNALGTATATDACGTPTVSAPSDGTVGSNGCNRSQTRTWTARDFCGNTSTASRTVTWTADNTAPVITTGGTTTTLGCNPSAGDINNALGTATATDACGTPTVSAPSDGTVGSDGCNRSQTRTWTARDFCGNTSTASRTVTWIVDVTPPVFTSPTTPIELGCVTTSAVSLEQLGGGTATDACGTPTVTFTDGSVQSNGCARSATRTFTATDACGNTATSSRTVTFIFDPNPPVITTGGTTTTLGCNPSAGDINNALGTATATDACSTPTVSAPSDGTVGSNGCLRSQTRTWTARDFCGNTSTASRTVTWTADVTPPVITTGGTTTTLGCNPSAGDINNALGTATATDACSTPSLVSSSDGTVGSDGCTRTQTRRWTFTDFCGNTATASRSISWTADVTPPVITTGGTTTTLGCNPSAGDINNALGTATATDACGIPTVSAPSDGTVGSNGCLRSQTRTWTARDFCGNTSTASRTVTWTADVTPPVITTGGTTTTLGCNPSAGDINNALGTATATDACGTPTVSAPSDGTVGSNGCNRSQTRTWTARDFCGNTSTASRTVTWIVDVTPPVFTTTPASVDLACNAAIPTAATPTATDACGTPTVTQTGTTDNATDCATGFARVVTRTWRAQDACGNTATYTQTIRVECCLEALCTYTQGAYGNAGGQDCDGTTTMSTTDLINQSIANWGGTITIGKPGKSITIVTGQASCVIASLPGGGPAKELPSGNSSICSLPASLTQGGRIKNVLLAQTITLALNIGITSPSDLGSFPLQVGELATADPLGGCGDETPTPRECIYSTEAPYALIDVKNEYTYRTFTQEVIDAIPGANTVANLLELANRALANVDGIVGSENGASLSAIANAAAAVNEVFDECKVIIGWDVDRCAPTDPTKSAPAKIAPTTTTQTLEVTAFPNPYQENFSLKVKSPVSGQATIGFYTIDGVKIGEMKRDVVANRDQWVPFNVPAVYRTRIVYTVGVGKYNAKGVVLSPN